MFLFALGAFGGVACGGLFLAGRACRSAPCHFAGFALTGQCLLCLGAHALRSTSASTSASRGSAPKTTRHTDSRPPSARSNTPTQNGSSKNTVNVSDVVSIMVPPLSKDGQRRDNPEGQVTYLANGETAGLPSGSGAPTGARCVFIFAAAHGCTLIIRWQPAAPQEKTSRTACPAGRVPQRTKLVTVPRSVSGSGTPASLPAAKQRIIHTMWRARLRSVCIPSPSSGASSATRPWARFQ